MTINLFSPTASGAILFLCCLVANVSIVFTVCFDPLRVCLYDAGCYVGRYMRSFHDNEMDAFLGIPYSQRPARFQEPQRYYSNTTHISKSVKHDCIQRNYFSPTRLISGKEDCLYLNVYRPTAQYAHLLPVMVYFHGGGFFVGTASPLFAGPEYIMDHKDIILVTVAYRLGPFGFMGTSDGAIPGNLGLKDQAEALQWVNRNIERFGGDRFRVTIIGQDAGGIAVQLHTFSLLSRNTFHSIIAISGTANTAFSLDENPDQTVRLTARYCNIPNWDTLSTPALARALVKVEANTLLKAGDYLKFWDIDRLVIYRPIVEPPFISSFLVNDPNFYIEKGQYWPVPSLYGRVPNEGSVRVSAIMEDPKLLIDFNSDFNNILRQMLEFPSYINKSQQELRTRFIIDDYIGGSSNLNDLTYQRFTDILTHRFYYYPLYNVMRYHVQRLDTTKYPVYWYNFKYHGANSFYPSYTGHLSGRYYGTIHCDDLIYLLRTRFIFPAFERKSIDATAIKSYVAFIVHFVKQRKPPSEPAFTPCNHTNFFPASGSTCDYHEFVIDNNTVTAKINNEWDTDRMKYWDDIMS